MTDIVNRMTRAGNDLTTLGESYAGQRQHEWFLEFAAAVREGRDEIERLRAAIRWALGEAPNADGKWFDEAKPHPYPKYWWRTEIRRALEPKL